MIEESLHAIQQRMADAMARVGRVDTALLVAVTKNHPVSAVEEAASLGVTHVGENRVQEAKEKQLTYKGPQLTWHLIGHLQVNKVRQAVPMFDLIHSVDSRKLLDEIEKVATKNDKVQDVLLQVNVAREASKTGMTVEEFPENTRLCKDIASCTCTGLDVYGAIFRRSRGSTSNLPRSKRLV